MSAPQVVPAAPEELLPHPLGGLHRHRGAPGRLPPGVQQTQRHVVLRGRLGGRGQLHAGAALHAEQRPEEETENLGKVQLNFHKVMTRLLFTAESAKWETLGPH